MGMYSVYLIIHRNACVSAAGKVGLILPRSLSEPRWSENPSKINSQ